MYTITNLLNPKLRLEDARDLWNKEMGDIYPISEDIFSQNILQSQDIVKSASGFAFDDFGLIGFLFAKEFTHPSIPKYHHMGFISLFYVAKKHRKQGVASKLLDMSEQILANKNKTEIAIGRDYHNFFPGVPCDYNNLTGPWLERRNYVRARTTHDLICWRRQKESELFNQQYEYRFATKTDEEALLDFFMRNFPGRWYYECFEFFKGEKTENSYFIALNGKEVIAFTRVNQMPLKIIPYNLFYSSRFPKLGALGPLGVDRNYRKQGLGKDIVNAGLNELIKQGCEPIIIDWTGLLEFYQQFGFEVWKTYDVYTKQIDLNK
jgi:predicted N-acetyltransferase YhbS